MGYVSDFVIGVLSNATFGLIVFVVAYVNRRWIKRQLMKWTLSGDVWWFCCDLHSVKLQSNLGRYDKGRCRNRCRVETRKDPRSGQRYCGRDTGVEGD